MLQMRLGNLKHRRTQRWKSQPLRNLMAKRADAMRDRATVLPTFAFAGNDQNQATAASLGVQDKMYQFGVRFRQSHAVQIDAGLGGKLATPHPGMCSSIHLQGGFGQGIGGAGLNLPAFGRPMLFAQKERGQTRLCVGKWWWHYWFGCGRDNGLSWVKRSRCSGDAAPEVLLVGRKVSATRHDDQSSSSIA